MSDYVSKQELHEQLVQHLARVKHAQENNLPEPPAPDAVGKAILDIATRLSTKYNFRGYSWRDEMISDGVIAAVKAINKYDPARSQNPFGYFTQCIYWAFQGRIKQEKAEVSARREMATNILNDFHEDGPDGVHHDINRDLIMSLWSDK